MSLSLYLSLGLSLSLSLSLSHKDDSPVRVAPVSTAEDYADITELADDDSERERLYNVGMKYLSGKCMGLHVCCVLIHNAYECRIVSVTKNNFYCS